MAALGNAFRGEIRSGSTVRENVVTAVTTIQEIMKSSLGPKGLDKLIVDQLGELTISNDGATILKRLETNHPIARMLVDLAKQQDSEVGDGTTSVVIFAAELVKRAVELMQKQKFHPATIIAGYRLATKEAVAYITRNLSIEGSAITDEMIFNVGRTTLGSKLISSHTDHFSQMCFDAVKAVRREVCGQVTYPINAISVHKTHGRSQMDSYLLHGLALDRVGRAAQGMPVAVMSPKVACIDFGLKQHRLQLGVSVEITDARELQAVREREKDICKRRIEAIKAAGANVVFTTGGLDDLALKYLVDAGIFAVRRVNKRDMKRICEATGARCVVSMSSCDEVDVEKFPIDAIGSADIVEETKIGDWDSVVVKSSTAKSCTLILRGANEFMLDEVERSVHDVLSILSRILESKSVTAGGGAVEVALSCHLDHFATTIASQEQSAVRAFSEALLVIPRQLCFNAAVDGFELVPILRAHHATGVGDRFVGLYLEEEGGVRDNLAAGVLESALGKKKSIKYATDTAIAILRIDDIVKLSPEPDSQKGR